MTKSKAKPDAKDRAPEIFLQLVPLKDDVPWPVRLKRALKCLLRSYGLRARAWADRKDLPADFREIKSE